MNRTKRMKSIIYTFPALLLVFGSFLAGTPSQQPVYVYLYAAVTDHVNLDMSEDRLRHILPAVEQYRQSHPEAHASATVLFSGAVSKALQERNDQTHIVDFVKDYIRRGVIEAGYDGTDEPTYDVRPTLKLSMEQSPQERWKIRQTVAEEFLTEARDPLTGAPTSGTGGLKEMQEVFGKATDIRGVELAIETYRPAPKVRPKPDAQGRPVPGISLAPVFGVFKEFGGDTETLQMLAKYNTTAISFGIPATNPAQLIGFREALTHFGDLIAPVPGTSPEVFWQDYVLRMSEAALPVHPVKALEGVEALKGVLDKANRSRVQLVQVQLGSVDNYLQAEFAKTAANAPVRYAYEHPQSPKLPGSALRTDTEIAAGWAKEDALLKWLADDYFRDNPGSRFLSAGDLSKMAGNATGFDISTESLRTAVSEAMKALGNDTHPFNYLRVDSHFLSLAELFQVLTDELAEFHRTGKLPQSVKAVKVYGPFRLVTGHGPNEGEVTSGDIESLCADLAGPLHDDTSTGVPRNSVPPLVKVNGLDLNPAQLLRLMSLALANPAPETKLHIRMLYLLGEAGAIFPKSRPLPDVGFVWTLKPAPLTMNP